MGGDPFTLAPPPSEDESSVVQESSSASSLSLNGEDESVFDGLDELGSSVSAYLELEAHRMKRFNDYKLVLHTYNQMPTRTLNLEEAKARILSYTPGGWTEKVGRMTLEDYNVPETTTLVLVGPKGSGKSSLVNRISKVFEQDKFAPERAQVSYNSSVGEGTYFLQEYKIPRGSDAFCLYDTRGLSNNFSDNVEMLKHWITKGVHNGELIISQSDDSSLRTKLKSKARNGNRSRESRMVNFVIFVVSGLEILKSMDYETTERTEYEQMISTAFNSPYLSFRDDKPVVVMTHGDLFSLHNRANARVHLGQLLGIPPAQQIFEIPETSDPLTELTIIDMLRYSLEHADKNLPTKDWFLVPKFRVSLSFKRNFYLYYFVYLLFCIGLVIISDILCQKFNHHASKSKAEIDWHSIRHLWLD